ncbi:MAG: UDP-3-O-acylglucosamine N-acyltransferase [Verrucomicrobiaceae bacterium]|nr:UDP-3-O-acylglucosamine N-acyltransferase [Verrucomicrobiaceae bacterium]
MNISLMELAKLLAVALPAGTIDAMITGFASLREARRGDLSFFSGDRHRQSLADTQATAVLVPEGTPMPGNVTAIVVADPSAMFDTVVDKYGFHATPEHTGIHPSAVVAEGVFADPSRVAVGANAVVEEGALIGPDVEIGAGCYVGRSVHIGAGSKLFANVSVHEGCILGERVILHSGCVIGADGFGYEFVDGQHRKVRQSGIVQIDNDVEIGANSAVDRARFGRTWIGEGTKIDNLVQVGHNVVIGKHCILVSGTAIAGSAQIGDYVVLAAQVGVAGHVTIGSQCTVAARGGVTKDLPAGSGIYMGFPAVPVAEERRRLAGSRRLPELLNRVKKLERDAASAKDSVD